MGWAILGGSMDLAQSLFVDSTY